MSAENICNQPKQLQLQMLLRSWLTPIGGGRLSAQYLRKLTKAKAKQNMYACSQELLNSPATKRTHCSSLPRTRGWICHSNFHRLKKCGCPPKQGKGEQSIPPKEKGKTKPSISETGNKHFYLSLSEKTLVISHFSHCNGPSAPTLSHVKLLSNKFSCYPQDG